ncbi:MAG: permease [Pseudomonadota bacterium]
MTDLSLQRLGDVRQRLHGLRSPWAVIVLLILAAAILDQARLPTILQIATSALISTLPYIAFAVLLIAWLRAAGAEGVIARVFEGREYRMIILAALLGGLAPFCSCEVVPFIAGLMAAGAPLSAIMAFWLASPLIDPPSLVITAGALGWEFAIGKTVSAVGIGLLGGFATLMLVRSGLFASPLRPDAPIGSGCGCGPDPFKSRPVWRFWQAENRRATFLDQAKENALFLIKWLALAYVLEALLIEYVPAESIGAIVGGEGLLPIILGAAVGAPAYLNGYAAPPLIAGLMDQGMSPGAAMSFMVAGAVSSIPAMAAVWSLVRKPVFAAYVAFGFLGAVIAGISFAAIV